MHSFRVLTSLKAADNKGMEEKYTAALIGTGRIGFLLGFDKKREQPASHTMALLGNKKISLIAAADTDSERLLEWKKYMRRHGVPAETFSASGELYRKFPALDIIVVAVNEESHLNECIKAVEQKPRLVILEKPVALNSAEAEEIVKCAKEAGVPVMVNHERRFDLNYRTAVSWIEKIGDIQRVDAELDSGLRIYGKEFEKDGSYSLLHDGTHLVDIVRCMFDVDLKNPSVTGAFRDEKGWVRNFSAHYSTKKIPEINILMSGRSKFFEFKIEALGTLGRFCIGNGIAELYMRKESGLYTGFYSLVRQRVRMPAKSRYFSGMVQSAVEYLDGKCVLKSPLEEAVKDLAVLEEIKSKL